MHSHLSRALSLAAAALLVAGAAQAQGRSNDRGQAAEVAAKEHPGSVPQNTQVVRGRDGQVLAVRVPPGLARKPGQMPPGQYKKLYNVSQGADALGGIFRGNGYTVTRVVQSGNSRYVYYRLRNGREQRAIVQPGADRLRFSNVPPSLLQQVMTRLY